MGAVAKRWQSEREPRLSSRLGITTSRKVGNAVTRNRIKRRVREWFRQEHAYFPEGMDVVVIARRAAATTTHVESTRKLSSLRERSQSGLMT